jgi:hypothetical protein
MIIFVGGDGRTRTERKKKQWFPQGFVVLFLTRLSHEEDEDGCEVKQRGGRKSVQRDCGIMKKLLSVPFTILLKMGFHVFLQSKQTKTFRKLRKKLQNKRLRF